MRRWPTCAAMRGSYCVDAFLQTVASRTVPAFAIWGMIGGKRVTIRNFLVFDYHDRYPEARAWLGCRKFIAGG